MNDILSGDTYYSVDDTNYGSMLISQYCSFPSLQGNNFHDELPDSIYLQMKNAAIKDSIYTWDIEAIHKPASKKVYFPGSADINLIMDIHTKWDTGGSVSHKDSIANRRMLIRQTLKKYNNPSGYYIFHRPIFDKSCTYAIFYHEHFCKLSM